MTGASPATLDPGAAQLLALLRPAGAPRLHQLGVERARAYAAALPRVVGPGPRVGEVRDVRLPVDGGEFVLRHYEHPDGATGPAVVFVHGGGWTVGGLDDQDALVRHLVLVTARPAVSVGYRLAPEHPFPTPLNDVVAAVEWTASEIGGPVVLVGESAGANLCAALAGLARDGDAAEVAAQVLVCPIVDHVPTASYEGRDPSELIDGDDLRWFWELYCPAATERDDPRAAPLRDAAAGLPPTLLVTAGHDPLRDEGLAYATRLRDAGVDLRHRHAAHLMHGFLPLMSVLPAAFEIAGEIGTFVQAETARAVAVAR